MTSLLPKRNNAPSAQAPVGVVSGWCDIGAPSRLIVTMACQMPNEIDHYLRPKLEQRYKGNAPAIDAGKQLLTSFKGWIAASQPYRHGQEVEDAIEPPQDFVVAHLSAGATFLRWMDEFALPPTG
jgi:hypothetical protein